MGWANGSELAEMLWERIEDLIPEDRRAWMAYQIGDVLEAFDADSLEEVDNLIGHMAQRRAFANLYGAPLYPKTGALISAEGMEWRFNGIRWDLQ